MADLKRILVLGSGLVARPCVEYLLRDEKNIITIACRTLSTAQNLAAGFLRTTAIALDVSNKTAIDVQISSHNLIISLVPYNHHVSIIRSAIIAKVNVITTSYISPAMRALDSEVKEAGIIVFNEVGLDPGIDHLYAIKTISEVHAKGGKIKEFHSYCGGLPAPEFSHNPLRFKFSWSPKGALMSQDNSARFLLDGKFTDIPASELMKKAKPYRSITEEEGGREGYEFVSYPNRDSTPFREFYGIPEAETVVRGSLRYAENPEFIQALKDIGLLNPAPQPWLKKPISWSSIIAKLTNATTEAKDDEEELHKKVLAQCKLPTPEVEKRVLRGFHDLGFFWDYPIELPILATEGGASFLDVLSEWLATLLSYRPGERDLVVLQHRFVVEWPAVSSLPSTQTITSTLCLEGDPEGSEGGYSAMARTVGVTCGIASQLVLDGENPAFKRSGIWAPYSAEICDPIRLRLEEEGIRMAERVL